MYDYLRRNFFAFTSIRWLLYFAPDFETSFQVCMYLLRIHACSTMDITTPGRFRVSDFEDASENSADDFAPYHTPSQLIGMTVCPELYDGAISPTTTPGVPRLSPPPVVSSAITGRFFPN
jgi:hypothetical protein